MKNIFIFLYGLLFLSCQSGPVSNIPVIPADSLANHISQYIGKEVILEGKIIHVCPVDGSKMKFSGTNRQIVKIVPFLPGQHFESQWNGKQVRIRGVVQEIRLSRSYVDSICQAGTLLCHIDFSPCSDTAWVAAKHRQGKAEESVRHYHEFLIHEMQRTGKEYISVILLQAIQTEELQVITENIQTSHTLPDSHNCSHCPLCGLCPARNKTS